MGLRARFSKRRGAKVWDYRFKVAGHEYSGRTDLEATPRNRAGAKLAEGKHLKQVMTGESTVGSRIERPDFSRAADRFIEWVRQESIKPATAKRIECSFASLRGYFGNCQLSAVTSGAIEEYKTHRRQLHKVKEITLYHDLCALSKFAKWVMKQGWLDNNPVAAVDKPSTANAMRIYVVPADEERRYFEAAALHRDLHDLAKLIRLQGMRPGEVLALTIADVDLAAGKLTIREGKTTAARRRLTLAPESAALLARRLDDAAGRWVFPSPKFPGRAMAMPYRAHEDALAVTGLSFVLYDFRHTFATELARTAGVSITTLAAILGHASIRIVQCYVHPTESDMDRAMQLVAVARAEVATKRVM
jgi:integrase